MSVHETDKNNGFVIPKRFEVLIEPAPHFPINY